MAEEGDEALLSRLVDLSHAYAKADPSCLIPLQESLSALLGRTKDVSGREALGEKGAVASLIDLVPSLAAHSQVLVDTQPLDRQIEFQSTLEFPDTGPLLPLLLLFRGLRNLCAGVEVSQSAFRAHGGHELVAVTTDKLLEGYTPRSEAQGEVGKVRQSLPSDVVDLLRAALQLLGNFAGGGAANQDAVWSRFYPDLFQRLASLPDPEIQEPLCMAIYTCCRTNPPRRLALATQGIETLSLLLSATAPKTLSTSTDSHPDTSEQQRLQTGGGDFFQFLIRSLCICDNLFLPLFHALPPPSPPFTSSHVSLLSHLNSLLASEAARPPLATSAPSDCLPAGVATSVPAQQSSDPLDRQSLLAVLDIVREAARAVRRKAAALPSETKDTCSERQASTCRPQASASSPPTSNISMLRPLPTGDPDVGTIRESLALLRTLCSIDAEAPPARKRGTSTTLDNLSSGGLVRLMLDLLRCLGPPGAAKRTRIEEEWVFSGEAAACYPMTDPYVGYRRDVVAVIGNACFRHRGNQEEVRAGGALLLVLQQCQVDEGRNPFLREWGLWAVRNLLEGNEKNTEELASLEARGGVDTPEVRELGLTVEVNAETGRPRLVNVPASANELE